MEGKRFIQTIRLDNVLSYGPDSSELPMEPLNVLIGPNASGKSNLIEIIALLASAPRDLQHRIRLGGGASEWLWKGSEQPGISTIEVTVESIWEPIRYRLSFTESSHRFVLVDEVIEHATPPLDSSLPNHYYRYRAGKPTINLQYKPDNESGPKRYISDIPPEEIDIGSSILSQRQEASPELTYLANCFAGISFYPTLNFPISEPPRQPGKVDSPISFLSELGHNLSSVLSNLLKDPDMKSDIMLKLKGFYPNISDIVFDSSGNNIQMYFHENSLSQAIPATKMSDGSLHYLCLLATLCHPDPPPVICIENPEAGLHPDIIIEVADLLVDTSKRSQLFVTTHSDVLVDALTEVPESIIICEKPTTSTQLTRLDKDRLEVWLKDYRLGDLWTSGHFGGNRW